ncbi:hypothetical protein B0H19DRAFT_1122803 [Mycena capillaripes]|nr:hypothetical protein B0H19DRAFT_1122803 [Mycena capillaripes]
MQNLRAYSSHPSLLRRERHGRQSTAAAFSSHHPAWVPMTEERARASCSTSSDTSPLRVSSTPDPAAPPCLPFPHLRRYGEAAGDPSTIPAAARCIAANSALKVSPTMMNRTPSATSTTQTVSDVRGSCSYGSERWMGGGARPRRHSTQARRGRRHGHVHTSRVPMAMGLGGEEWPEDM